MIKNALLNRVEILFYSTLISAMSGMSKLRSRLQDGNDIPIPMSQNNGSEAILQDELSQGRALSRTWNSIKEAVPQLFLWIVLGFAAGFLIGMLTPG